MKKLISSFVLGMLAAALLSGCKKSSDVESAGAATPAPAAPQAPPPAPSAPAVPAAPTVAARAASNAAAQVAGEAADLGAQLTAFAQSKSDQTLSEISRELSASTKPLSDSLASQPELKSSLQSTLQSLLGGQDSQALGFYQKLTEAKLTPDQTKLVTDTWNSLSAFVVQRNFSTLSGAESEVSQLVSSLRKGDVAGATPLLQKVANNASLTPSQKELLTSLADKYAPALKKAGAAVQQGLKGLTP